MRDLTKSSANFVPALLTGNRLKEKYPAWQFSFGHSETSVPTARMIRNERLADFLQADAAAVTLFHARAQTLERAIAIDMLTGLYRALGVKAGDETEAMVEGALSVLLSNDIALASELWRPLKLSPAILSLACRKLIATAIYQPKPAEVHAACEDAGNNLLWAYQAADELREYVRRADAVLLQFAPDEWRQPYQTPQYRPALARMLELHWGEDHDDDNQFMALVNRERRRLLAIEAPAKLRVAASWVRPAVKTKRPKPS